MIRRLYVNNFRCLQNFDLPLAGRSSILLIGQNGAGKTTVGEAFTVLQRIAKGTNRVGKLIQPQDLPHAHPAGPVRFEIEASLPDKVYTYEVAFELPDGFKELRVLGENLVVDGHAVFRRQLAQVKLSKLGREKEVSFPIDWHLVALPIIQERSKQDPISIFKSWLANALILRPIPTLISGESDSGTLQPDADVKNIGEWFSGLIAFAPSSYSKILEFLREVMPDIEDIRNPVVGSVIGSVGGSDVRRLELQFSGDEGKLALPFQKLSDGEKCFMIYALVIAANRAYGPLLCYWDEPDNFLAPFEVGPSIMALRRAFRDSGQFIATSHNPQAVQTFTEASTFILGRKSHLEPTVIRSVEDAREAGKFSGNFLEALSRGDVSI